MLIADTAEAEVRLLSLAFLADLPEQTKRRKVCYDILMPLRPPHAEPSLKLGLES